MNKIEVCKGLYRQNVYNLRLDDKKEYSHLTCYFDSQKNIIAIFNAGENTNMTSFFENTDNNILSFSKNDLEIIVSVLSEYTYDHIKPVNRYDVTDNMFQTWLKIWPITERDLIAIELYNA